MEYAIDYANTIQNYTGSTGQAFPGSSENIDKIKAINAAYQKFNLSLGAMNAGQGGQKDISAGEGDSLSGSNLGGSLANLPAMRAAMAARKKLQEEKLAHYKKKVGNTPRGKKMMEAAAVFQNQFSSPLSQGGAGRDNSAASSSGGEFAAVAPPMIDSGSDSRPKSNYDFGGNDYGSGFGGGSSSSSYDETTGMSNREIDQMLDSARKDKNLSTQEGDTLFTIVTKTYGRNLSRLFDKKVESKPLKGEVIDETKNSKLNKKQREELQKLMQ
jgi:hypothetical protein